MDIDDDIKSLPNGVRSISTKQTKAISKRLSELGVTLARVSENISRESDIQEYRSEIDYHINTAIDDTGQIMYQFSKEAMKYAITSDVGQFRVGLQKVDNQAYFDYLVEAQDAININIDNFLKRKSLVDGKTLEYRLKTIKKGTSNVVESTIRQGLAEGKTPYEIGRDIQTFVKRDRRTRWTTPSRILNRGKGLPLSAPYGKNNAPAGSVDYNALRIARTEMINNYRWAKIEVTKGKDWVVGWKWTLSASHGKPDQCDTWANHDEGLGKGVYSSASKISGLGHPHCLCNVTTITVFNSSFRSEIGEDRFKELYPKYA